MKKYNHKSFIISLLRRGTFRFPYRNEALKAAKVSYGTYKCNMCKHDHRRKDVYVDHIEPVVGIEGFTDWNTYIDRMYPQGAQFFQVLCQECHATKTQQENQARRMFKSFKKKSLTKPKNKRKVKK